MAECSTCHGRHYIDIPGAAATIPPMPPRRIPCPQCQGSGDESCCEGAVGGPYEVTNGGT